MSRLPDHKIIVRDGDATTAQVAEWEADRRDLMRRGVALGGALVGASAIPLLLGVRNAFAQANTDGEILASAVGLEQVAVFAYQAAVDSKLLDKDSQRVAQKFRDQEQEHADGLTAALKAAGGSPPAKPKSVADVDKVLKGLGDVKNANDILAFAIELETAAVAAYYDAHQKLQDAQLLQTGAAIMANEGQHLVVLRKAAGKDLVPNAFETGAS